MANEPNLGASMPDLLNIGGWGGLTIAALAFVRWLLDLAIGTTRSKLDQLERERIEDRKLLMAITQALFEVMNVVERHEPDAPALEHARAVLKKAFPADAPDHYKT